MNINKKLLPLATIATISLTVFVFLLITAYAKKAYAQNSNPIPINDDYYTYAFSANTQFSINCLEAGPERVAKLNVPYIGEERDFAHIIDLHNKSPLTNGIPVQTVGVFSTTSTTTDWTNINAQKQNIYCAVDKDGKSTCTDKLKNSISQVKPLPPDDKVKCQGTRADNSNAGINECLSVLTKSRTELIPQGGNITIPNVSSFSQDAKQHEWFAIQNIVASGSNTGSNSTDDSGLKLSSFKPTESVQQSSFNCAAVYWDPLGYVFTANNGYLSPVSNTNVRILTVDGLEVPVLGGYRPTNKRGEYSLYTSKAGTFKMSISKSGYKFPMETGYPDYGPALSALQKLFPKYEFYAWPEQKFYEGRGEIKLFYSLIQGQNENPAILNLETTSNGTTHSIKGLVSHPLAIIKAYVQGKLVGEGQAAENGVFIIDINNQNLPQAFDSFDVQAESVSIAEMLGQQQQAPPDIDEEITTSPQTLIRNIKNQIADIFGILPVKAQQVYKSEINRIEPVPSFVGGFAYSESLRAMPNAKVQIVIPSLGNLVYTTAQANSDGFIYIGSKNIPGLPYSVRVVDSSGSPVSEFSANEFALLNEGYRKIKDINYYQPVKNQPSVLSKPNIIMPDNQTAQTLAQAQPKIDRNTLRTIQRKSTLRRARRYKPSKFAKTNNSYTSAESISQENQNNKQNSPAALAIIVIALTAVTVGGAYLFIKARSSTQTYEY